MATGKALISPVVISDTSPIRALDHLGQLGLLAALFDGVLVPPAVRDELLEPRPRFRAVRIEQIPGASVRAPVDLEGVRLLEQELQRGEAEAIVLARETGLRLLIDERAGRVIATQYGLPITGVVGVLVAAKSAGHIPAVLPLLHKLRDELGFFLSPHFLEEVRRETGE